MAPYLVIKSLFLPSCSFKRIRIKHRKNKLVPPLQENKIQSTRGQQHKSEEWGPKNQTRPPSPHPKNGSREQEVTETKEKTERYFSYLKLQFNQ